ncbi:right-handed parallel beta-helix repeat-containing protein, partial [Nocardioides sp.]|uniref:right-handed parallel beta-helix repeat-containing protein n=1 Tax=Nocardioides sp. TaxID=35761 RepID=UPI001A1A6EDB
PAVTRRAVGLLAAAVVAAALTILVPGSPAQAAVVYRVSPSGSDTADGLLAPWRTIQKATATAPPGATILVETGTYEPFTVTKAGQTVTAAPGHQVRVVGRAGVQDVVRLAAPGVTLSGVTVTGCVPDPSPPGGVGDNGSSAVRIHDGATGVTVRGVTIRDSRGTNQHGLPFGCYGVFVHGADAPVVVGNDISGTGTGVYLNGGGKGALVADNHIHGNDVLIRNTPGGSDDYGANGVTFANVDALPGAVATRNVITGNSGPSADYGYDGGAFEIFNSSHVRMVANTIADNENVLETGTSPDGNNPLGDCVGNVFAGNDARGRAPGSRLERSIGLILRCATAMVVQSNTFADLDWFVYAISTGDVFSSDVNGLAITGNTVSQWQKVYHLGVDPLAARLVVDANRIHFTGPVFASYGDGTTSATLADWQARSGQDRLTTTS